MDELSIALVSGGTGRTLQHVLQACLAQFPGHRPRIAVESPILSTEAALQVVQRAAIEKAVIFHSLVDPVVRHVLVDQALAAGLSCVDLMGPTLAVLGERFGAEPRGTPGLLYELHREQFERMDAVDFTMAHDDGNRMCDLEKADVVLVGISRVSKSVTCFYLACRGIRAANVPLVSGLPAPDELMRLEPGKVVGLTMNASHLASVRRARLERIAANHEILGYADIRELNHQIRQAEKLFADRGWTRIDVSYMATEEVASEILQWIRERPQTAR